MKTSRTIEISIFTALVYVATVLFQVYQPATGGYFNLGETMIYLAALTANPLTAAIAGGIGASLADVTTGYGIFAPGTLVIKFTEGYVAGFLVKKSKGIGTLWTSITTGLVYGIALALVGSRYLSGTVYLGTAWKWASLNISMYFWLLLGGVFAAIVVIYSIKGTRRGESLSLLSAGLLMVLGYFLYEYFISNPLIGRPRIAALFEVPVNIGQAVIGATIALSIYGFLLKAGYLKRSEN
jgi:uncharacterized membrane protein